MSSPARTDLESERNAVAYTLTPGQNCIQRIHKVYFSVEK